MLAIPCLVSCNSHNSRSHNSSGEGDDIDETEAPVNETPGKAHPCRTLDLKLYMESSGSMYSFDAAGSKGEFKRSIADMLNRFPGITGNDTSSVFIVNDNIYNYDGSVRDFLANREFFTSIKNIGNPSYTDFDKIFDIILAETQPNQVSVLITDLIYSVDGQGEVTASKLLNEAYTLTHNVFKGHTADMNLIAVKLTADFLGNYYPYNSPNKGTIYNGDRPFYALIFASDAALCSLYECPDYKSFVNFSSIPGYDDMFCFTDMTFKPHISIIPNYAHEGRFRKSRSKNTRGAVSAIDNVELSRNGKLTIPVALNLSDLPLTANYKANKDNYIVESNGRFEIEWIRPINDLGDYDESDGKNNGLENITKLMPDATHLMMISTQEIKNESISIKMTYRLPAWINRSSSDDDSDIHSDTFSTTTFGLKDVMRGIFAAYVPEGSTHYLFSFDIDIKKK
ncbi:MAG: hypothetical protein K2L05_04065 [Muribaculaceae bacterium]|nr:hypothetical protein [Muribaculaceae bacterium]